MVTIFLNFILPLIASVILLWLYENKKFVLERVHLSPILLIIALLIPAYIAGTRNIISIGDTKLYGELIFNKALSSRWDIFYDFFHNGYYSIETGYLIITYIVSILSSDYKVLFFITNFINVFLIYDGLKKIKKHIDIKIWLGMFVFYMIFFGETLNIVRQSLGLAIVFWGIHYIFENKPLKYIVVVLIASAFHISCLIGLLVLLLFKMVDKKDKKQIVNIIIISVSCLAAVLLYPKLFEFIRNLNILPSKFFSLYYLKETPVSPFAIATKLPFIIIYLMFMKKDPNDKFKYFFLLVLMLDLIISQLAGGNDNLYRFALIFSYYKMIVMSKKYDKKYQLIVILYSVAYFYMEYIYQGALPVELFS